MRRGNKRARGVSLIHARVDSRPSLQRGTVCCAAGWAPHGYDRWRLGGHGMDIGLLLLRLVVGLTVAAHGGQKLFGWFGGYGLAGTGGWLESIGFRPGKLQAAVAGGAEFVGGLLL